MLASVAVFEVMDKEPPLWLISLYFLSLGAAGMLSARRRPVLCAPFIAAILVGAFALYLELRDPSVGNAILRERGFAYVAACGCALVAGIGMPLLGAFVGARHLENSLVFWRPALGTSGALLLGLTLFVGSGFVRTAYYNYILWPREKAEDHYIMPLRWQDIVAEASIACVLVGLLLLSAYLLRSGFRPQKQQP
jgi:hypothetical protein